MKEIIKFRGKKVDYDEWVYGHYFYNEVSDVHNITDGKIVYPVKPETVGQFRNKQDRNNKDIYNGDIVREWFNNRIDWGIKLVDSSVELPDRSIWYGSHNESDTIGDIYYEIIGNITENPELIETEIKTISVTELKMERVKEVFRNCGVLVDNETLERIIDAVDNPLKVDEKTRHSLTSKGVKYKKS